MHHRHVRPWELFIDDDEASSEIALKKGSFDSLGSSNSFEDEPWVAKYDNRNIIRKIFDREVWIQEPALRQIQDTIFVQALITAFTIGAIITAVFLAVSLPRTCIVNDPNSCFNRSPRAIISNQKLTLSTAGSQSAAISIVEVYTANKDTPICEGIHFRKIAGDFDHILVSFHICQEKSVGPIDESTRCDENLCHDAQLEEKGARLRLSPRTSDHEMASKKRNWWIM